MWPTRAAGPFPQAVTVDPATHTVYTANCNVEAGCTGHTVSVIDGATCNARVTSGCGRAPATVAVGSGPMGLAVNPVTDTVYVANSRSGTVSVINGAACNGTDHSGCGNTPPVIRVGGFPFSVAVNPATDTIYVINGAGRGKISVINGAACNGTDHSGCGNTPPAFTTNSPAQLAVGRGTNTLYVANFNATTVSVINGATCAATNLSGCGHQAALTVGSPTTSLGIDQRSGTVFADFEFYGTRVFMLDGARCNARLTSGCHRAPVVVPAGGWTGNLATTPAAHTLYVTDNVDAQVSFFGYGPHGVCP
jgi:serine/threonine-protein kinase